MSQLTMKKVKKKKVNTALTLELNVQELPQKWKISQFSLGPTRFVMFSFFCLFVMGLR